MLTVGLTELPEWPRCPCPDRSAALVDPAAATWAYASVSGGAARLAGAPVAAADAAAPNQPASVTANNVSISEGGTTVVLNASRGNIVVADPDDLGGAMAATVTLDRGTVTAVGGSATVTGGLNTNTITLSGTEAELNASLKALTVALPGTTADWYGTITVSVAINDGGNTGDRPDSVTPGSATSNPGSVSYADDASAQLVTTRTFTVTVNGVQDTPTVGTTTLTFPATAEDTADASAPTATVASLIGVNGASIGWSDADDQSANQGGNAHGTPTYVAIVGNGALASQGRWQYTLNGANWFDVPTTGLDASHGVVLVTSASLRFVPAADYNGDPGNLTLKVADDTTSYTMGTATAAQSVRSFSGASWTSNQITVDGQVTSVNDAPAFTALGGTVSPVSAGTPVVLDADAGLADVELDAGNSWSGAVLTLARQGGASTDDSFEGSGTLSLAGAGVTVGGTTVGTFTQAGGTLSITFGAGATAALVDAVARQIAYRNTSASPPASVTIAWGIGDGNAGGVQGTGGALAGTGTVTVALPAINAAPTLTATGAAAASYTEGSSTGASLFSGTSISTVESGQKVKALTLTVAGLADGSNETLVVDGTAIALANGTSGTTTGGNGLGYSVSATGSTATLSLTSSAGLSTATAQSMVDAIGYKNSSFDPTAAARTVTLTSIQDDGGTSSGGVDTTSLTIAASVSVATVNDAPTLSATSANPTFTENGAAQALFSDAGISAVESGQRITGLTLTVGGVADGLKETLAVDGTTIALSNGTSGTTTGGSSLSYSVSVSGSTATVSLSNTTGLTATAMQSVVNGITYAYTGDAVVSGTRPVTIATLVDNGGTANGGHDTNGSVGKLSTATVTGVNDAPVLSDTVLALGNVAQNASPPAGAVGTAVSGLVALNGNVSDADSAAVTGIALIGVNVAEGGTWYCSTNGGTNWVAVGTVDGTSNALLLRPQDRLYYDPSGNSAGVVSSAVTLKAWDQTTGTAGSKVAPSGSAFSSATDTASLLITPAAPPGDGGPGDGGGGSPGTSTQTSTQTVDGVVVQQTTQTASDGTRTETLSVPVVTATRREEDATTADADIPLARDTAGQAVLEAHLPVGVGLQVEAVTTGSPGSGLEDLIRAIERRTQDEPPDKAAMISVGQTFLTALPQNVDLTVRTIIPVVADSAAPPSAPIIITGTPSAGTGGTGTQQQAIVIDARTLPTGTTIQLQDIAFAAVIGAVLVTGGEGSQVVVGDSAAQFIVLGADDDTLRGGGGDDHVGSKSGNDLLYGEDGNDSVQGGDDGDMLFGNAGTDLLLGNVGADTLFGGRGTDTVFGGRDDDVLYGDGGNDQLHGDRGSDTLVGADDSDRLTGGEASDLLLGNTGNDLLLGNMGMDTLFGGRGDDAVFGGRDDDRLSGDDEADTLEGDDGADMLLGNTGNDLLLGNMGADTLFGGRGDDTLFGGRDDDRLSGDAGDDQLWGDGGNDTLTGGDGADVFAFSGASGHDKVDDFSIADGDRMGLAAGATYTVRSNGAGDAVIVFSNDDDVTLSGIVAAQVDATWFLTLS